MSKLKETNHFLIRWFVTVREIKLCGHATMAASHVLLTEQHRYSDLIDLKIPLRFETKFGTPLEATGDGQNISLDFPLNEPVPIKQFHFEWLPDLQAAIVGPENVHCIEDVQYSPNKFVLIRLNENVSIADIKPDFARMMQIKHHGSVIMVVITQKWNFARTGAHFAARSFGPWHHVNEDPVCGSACTVLAPYWAHLYTRQEGSKGNVDVFFSRHASARGGLVSNRITKGRVYLSGQANIFCKGYIQV